MLINFFNIEEIIFFNKKLYPLLNNLRNILDSWQIGYRFNLDNLRKQAKLDLLANLKDYLPILEEFFKDSIILEDIQYNIVKNIELPIEDSCLNINFDNLCVSRDKDKIYLTFWR